MVNIKAQQFIDLFKRLENDIRVMYGLSNEERAITWFRNNVSFARGRMGKKLKYCADVRNLLQHGEQFDDYGVNDRFLVTPSDPMIDTLVEVIEWIEGIPKAGELGVAVGQLCRAGLQDRILPVMKEMSDKSYTYVPILGNGCQGPVFGVFSENTLLTYIIHDGIIGFEEDSVFSEIEDLLPIHAHDSEVFEFVPVDMPATELIELYQESLQQSERLGAVFVTNSGKPTERLLRMITAWDMAAFF